MNKFLRHCYFATRYGDWNIGKLNAYIHKPSPHFFSFDHFYYDGDHVVFWVGEFYVGVSY